nr:site-specific DNA-methyltransferase [Actinomycetota bacterium]
AKGAAKQITGNAIKLLSELGKPATVAEIGKQRMRLAGDKLRETAGMLDVGFRCLRVDTTNMAGVLHTPAATDQKELALYTEGTKSNRTGEDLLFQVLLDWGLEITMAITSEIINGQDLFVIDVDALIACFSESVTPKVVSTIASRQPLRAVFRNSGFATDAGRINAEQIFREISPATEVKTI